MGDGFVTLYVIRRSDGKYFRGPAQFDHFMWWPDIREAMKFHSQESAERLRKGRDMGEDTEVVVLKHYRILWHSKIDRRRGFEIVDASEEKEAVADWSSRNLQDKEIDRVQDVHENGDLK